MAIPSRNRNEGRIPCPSRLRYAMKTARAAFAIPEARSQGANLGVWFRRKTVHAACNQQDSSQGKLDERAEQGRERRREAPKYRWLLLGTARPGKPALRSAHRS